MVALSAKFTILISWFPICIPLILLSSLMRLASTSTGILHISMDSRHPWQTHIGFKGSDRRPFILSLDSILVCATWNMWMNLSRYPNLCKAEKIKSTPRILQKDFIQFIWLIDYDTNSRKNVYSKVNLFLIASDWCSPIIVTRPNVFCIWFKN